MNLDELRELAEFDEVTQLQIDEFAKAIGRATQSDTVVVIVDTGKALQTAMHTCGPNEAESKTSAIHAMCMVAGGALSQSTNGTYELLIMEPDGRISSVLPPSTEVSLGRRP
jgi:exopolysaccharide biosynthesis protein